MAVIHSIHIYLCLLVCSRGALAQTEVSKQSDVCRASGSTACSSHSLTCAQDSTIIVVRARQSYLNNTVTQASCLSGICQPQCCSPGNFACSRDIQDPLLRQLVLQCWGKHQCSIAAQFDQAGPGDQNNVTCNAAVLMSTVLYRCVPDSSIRKFGDPSNTTSATAVARFSENEESVQNCLQPDSSLACDVTPASGVNLPDFWYMMVLESTAALNTSCSTLEMNFDNALIFTNSGCNALVTYTTQQFTVSGTRNIARLAVSFQSANPPRQFWVAASVSNSQMRMTCAKGSCIPTTTTTTSSGTTGSVATTRLTSVTPSPSTVARTDRSTETMTPTSTPVSSSSSSPTVTAAAVTMSDCATSFTESSSSTSDSATPNTTTSNNVTAYIIVICILAVLCVILIIVVVIVCLRKRLPTPDPTYDFPEDRHREGRVYASLHKDSVSQNQGTGNSSMWMVPLPPEEDSNNQGLSRVEQDPSYLTLIPPEEDPNYQSTRQTAMDPNYLTPIPPEQDPNYQRARQTAMDPSYLTPIPPEEDPNYQRACQTAMDPNYLNPIPPEKDPKYQERLNPKGDFAHVMSVPSARGCADRNGTKRPEHGTGSKARVSDATTDRLYDYVDEI